MESTASTLRRILDEPGLVVMPCCHDALSARLIERAGFPLTFMSGFAVAASRLALPDTGLISYGEVLDQGRNICDAVSIPVIGDADTGYGNPISTKRTVRGFAGAGFACVMIEDQLAPKRCGHTRGKQVVPRGEAIARMRAALDAREASRDEGFDILVMARTDARASEGLDEAIARANAFAELGADISFLEAPRDEAEMRRYCAEVPGPRMANLVEEGDTPMFSPVVLEEIGFKIVAHPLTLLSSSALAMQQALASLSAGESVPLSQRLDFASLRELVGFDAYDEELARYASDEEPSGD